MSNDTLLFSHLDPLFCQNCGGELTPNEISLLQCPCGYLVQLLCDSDGVDMLMVFG